MREIAENVGWIAAMVGVLGAFEFGLISPANGFFAAFALVILYTGTQLLRRTHMSWAEAAGSLITPSSYRGRGAFFSFAICAVLGVIVCAQAALTLTA